jgi:hypothetical protein
MECDLVNKDVEEFPQYMCLDVDIDEFSNTASICSNLQLIHCH